MISSKTNFILFIAAFFFIAIDLVISFEQYYQNAIDGDLVAVVLPMESYKNALCDPLGLMATVNHEKFGGAGRWFCHATEYFLFRKVFSFIGLFIKDKIEVLYLTATIFQFLCHWLMIIAIALYINIRRKINFRNMIFAGAFEFSTPSHDSKVSFCMAKTISIAPQNSLSHASGDIPENGDSPECSSAFLLSAN